MTEEAPDEEETKVRKRFCLILALLLAALALPALAEEQALWEYDDLNYYLKLNGELSGDVVIPSEVDGWAVSAIESSAFSNQNGVTSLTMPVTLRALQNSAISWMEGLTSVTLNEGLECIGAYNFSDCGALTSLTIPASVRIVNSAFRSCENLKEIVFKGECPIFLGKDVCFSWLPEDYVIYVPDDQFDAYAAALADCYDAAAHLQPSGQNAVTAEPVNCEDWFIFDTETGTITGYKEYHAFVEIPETIGGVAVKAIGEDAFHGDYSVYGLVLPEGLERVEARAFRQACNLDYVKFPTTLRTIADEAFHNAQIDMIDWSEGLEEIGARAFQYDMEEVIELPSTVRTIGESAFEGSGCQELYLSGATEHIGARAFADSPLYYMAFDFHELIDIAPDAFADTYLTDLDLPWDSSFENRDAYAALLAEQCPDCTVWINNPKSGGVAEYPVNELSVTTIENGVWTAYNGDQPDLTVWTEYDDVEVTALGDGLFKGNQTIRSFYPHHCGWFTTIGNEAFADSSVEYVELFGSITTIGDGAFRNCANITELTLPASLVSIGTGVLEGCTGLKKLIVNCDPAILPADMGEVLAQVDEVYAAANATDEQVRALNSLAGRPWYAPLPREGEQETQLVSMSYEPLPGDDFWYDEEYSRLDSYQGYELNLILPREIDGVQLTMVGGGMMNRASYGDNFDVELPVRSLVIPENYTEIPAYAFWNCDTLETVICYAPIENLQEGVFANCTSLREVVFVNGVHNIDRYVFSNCPSLETVYLGRYLGEISESAFLNEDQTESFPLENCITDPAQMPDVDALLAAVKSDPMPEPEPEPEDVVPQPVGDEGAAYFGTWRGTTMEMEGATYDLSEFGMTMVLTLTPDGVATLFDGEETDSTAWTVADGAAYLDGMALTLTDDGRLCMDEDGVVIYFAFEGEAAPIDCEPENAPAPAEGTFDRVDTRFVMTRMGDVTADLLGGYEYSMVFHADGTLDFVMGGTPIEGLTWTEGVSDSGAEAFVIDYFGTGMMLYAVWTDVGFEMDFMGAGVMYFEPEM